MIPDLITMMANLSQSLSAFEKLVSGLTYLLGILFVVKALTTLNRMTEPNSQESKAIVLGYLLGGAVMLFFPTTLRVMRNSVFGTGNSVLSYPVSSPDNIYQSMTTLLAVVGGIFFIKGCLLLMHPPTQESKHSTKGLFLIIASIFALNFNLTATFIGDAMSKIALFTMGNNS